MCVHLGPVRVRVQELEVLKTANGTLASELASCQSERDAAQSAQQQLGRDIERLNTLAVRLNDDLNTSRAQVLRLIGWSVGY